MEKIQKATIQDLNNFKVSTQNSFATVNDVLDAGAKGKNKDGGGNNE